MRRGPAQGSTGEAATHLESCRSRETSVPALAKDLKLAELNEDG